MKSCYTEGACSESVSIGYQRLLLQLRVVFPPGVVLSVFTAHCHTVHHFLPRLNALSFLTNTDPELFSCFNFEISLLVVLALLNVFFPRSSASCAV